MPFIYLTLKISLTLVPFAFFLFLNKGAAWFLYPLYFGLYVYFLGPYVLMLHNTCHRKLFKKQYANLVKYNHWFLGLFFGQTLETYFHHHIAMHHVENNLEDDLSSTMKYRRDSLRGFMHYLVSFYFKGILDLVKYFKQRSRDKFARKVWIGELASIAIILSLCIYHFYAGLFVFILPVLFTRFAMMSGNWAQHAFIDTNEPENIYKNSITCINSGYNKKCFNDGYHIGHHLRPGMHWTEMPGDFLKNIEKYRANEAIVFEGLDYFQIWFLLMTKNYAYLSKRLVPLSDETPDPINISSRFLKSRTRKIAAVA